MVTFRCNCGKEISEKFVESTGMCFDCYQKEKGNLDDSEKETCPDCNKPFDSKDGKYERCYSCFMKKKEDKDDADSFDVGDDDYSHSEMENHPYMPNIDYKLEMQDLGEKRRVSYESYLLNKSWEKKRLEKLEAVGNKCEDCQAPSIKTKLGVYHLFYDRLENENLKDLVVLCEACYNKKSSLLLKIRREFFSRK